MTNRAPDVTGFTSIAAGPHGGIDAAGATNVGNLRPDNEDAFLIATLQRSMLVHDASPKEAPGFSSSGLAGTLLMVADGMGGEGGGEVASRVAVNTVASYLLNVLPWMAASVAPAGGGPAPVSVDEQLASAFVLGDASVKMQAAHSSTPRMGTTLTMALVLWPELYLAHVGDTRCYLLRAGQLSRLTIDHTMAQKVAEEASEPVDPGSDMHHVLWNSLGGARALPEPQIVRLVLGVGDRLLLCSDGLTKHVSDVEILSVLSQGESNAASCARLVGLANAGGGSDNVTVLVADARATPEAARVSNGGEARRAALAQTLDSSPAARPGC